MNLLNNVLNKAPNPFKNSTQTDNSQENNNDLNSNGNVTNQDSTNTNSPPADSSGTSSSAFNIANNLTGNLTNVTGQVTSGVSGGVNYVSNIFKSTFKGDKVEGGESKSRKESLESTENRESVSKKESLTTGATNLLTNVWGKTGSLFSKQGDQQDASGGENVGQDENVQYNEDATDESNLLDNQKEGVSQKAFDSAKNISSNLGSFVFSMANKATSTVSSTANKIKSQIESTNIFADFTKEQQEFIKQHGGSIQMGEAPWAGCDDEENMKKQILSLSNDKRNFVRQPPSGVQFESEFDLQQMLPVCLTLLKEDENLNKMRFEIVPKLVNEESFWRNYFYRVSLIKQSNSLDNMNSRSKRQSSSESEGPDDLSPTGNPEPEFVSDYIQGSVTEEDVVSGMRQMGVSKTDSIKDDKQWLDELNKDLQEFEVVNKDCNDIKSTFDEELEKDLAEMN